MENRRKIFIWIILISMATAFSFSVDERQMNLLLVGVMATTPFFLFFQYPYLRNEEILIYLLLLSIVISSLRHFDLFRISSLLYTTLYLITFVYYLRLIDTVPLKIQRYIAILKFLLTAYFVVLVIQQFSVLMGFRYIINLILSDPEIYKLNSLAPEPFIAAGIITGLMYSYICMRELQLHERYDLVKDGWKDKFIWFMFLYQMITIGSGFAIVLLLLFLLRFLGIKKSIYLLPILVILFAIVLYLDLPAIDRVKAFSKAFYRFDIYSMIATDHSAAIRVVPTLLYFRMFDVININIWLGFGTDYSANIMPALISGINEGGYLGGLFPSFFIDRGLICSAILFAMIYKLSLIRLFSYDTLILVALIFSAGINTQLFWISILLFSTNKYLNSTTIAV